MSFCVKLPIPFVEQISFDQFRTKLKIFKMNAEMAIMMKLAMAFDAELQRSVSQMQIPAIHPTI